MPDDLVRDHRGQIIGAIVPWSKDQFEAVHFKTKPMSLGIAKTERMAESLFARQQAKNRAETQRPPPGWLTSRFGRTR
jgi:hypothetical protein